MFPDFTRRFLDESSPNRPLILLIRHAARGPLPPGQPGDAVPLLSEGVAQAERLGAHIGPRLATLHSSPVLRCLQTAAGIARGVGWSEEARGDRLLGDPGVYVEDGDLAWRSWLDLGHEGVMEHLVAGSRLPGLADPRRASARLTQHLIDVAGGRPGVHVFVTHDVHVTTLAAHGLGRALGRADWPAFLEALAIEEIGAEDATMRFRGWRARVSVGVPLDLAGDSDSG